MNTIDRDFPLRLENNFPTKFHTPFPSSDDDDKGTSPSSDKGFPLRLENNNFPTKFYMNFPSSDDDNDNGTSASSTLRPIVHQTIAPSPPPSSSPSTSSVSSPTTYSPGLAGPKQAHNGHFEKPVIMALALGSVTILFVCCACYLTALLHKGVDSSRETEKQESKDNKDKDQNTGAADDVFSDVTFNSEMDDII